jgi:hypothetical protein
MCKEANLCHDDLYKFDFVLAVAAITIRSDAMAAPLLPPRSKIVFRGVVTWSSLNDDAEGDTHTRNFPRACRAADFWHRCGQRLAS